MRKLLITLSLLSSLCARAEFYGLFVGITNYADATQNSLNLDSEAKKMRDLFAGPGNSNMILITNERATKSNIMAALKAQLKRAGENDRILFFYAGRADNESISSYDLTGGISYEEIRTLFTSSNAGKKMIFINNCKMKINPYTEDKAANVFGNDSIFVLQASRPNEKSLGSKELECGYFTCFLIEALKGAADLNGDGKVTAFELYAYINIKVSEKTDGQQHPVMTGIIDEKKYIFQLK